MKYFYPYDGDYWQGLLEKLTDIQVSEKSYFKQVLEIYATSIDYDPMAATSTKFFKKAQRKIHSLVHGQAATNFNPADAQKDYIQLRSMPANQSNLKEAALVKDYLNFAKHQGEREVAMTMQNWAAIFNPFLQINQD